MRKFDLRWEIAREYVERLDEAVREPVILDRRLRSEVEREIVIESMVLREKP